MLEAQIGYKMNSCNVEEGFRLTFRLYPVQKIFSDFIAHNFVFFVFFATD